MQEDSKKMIGKLYGEEPTIDMDVIRASIGNVESIVVDGDTRKTIITGGAGYGSEKYNALVRNIANDFKNISDECNSNMGGFSSKEYLDIKNRYHSLVSNIVEVIVGGENTLDIVMRADAADDATKACESVIQNGYNVGGTISIIRAALELLKGDCDEIDVEIYDHIRRAFRETTQEIFFNKYFGADRDRRNFVVPSDKTIEINNIIDTAVSKGIMYDLVKEEYNEDIINSAHDPK
jgi:chaperonin GroEL (HSP60 family)